MRIPTWLSLFVLLATLLLPIGTVAGFMIGRAWNSGGLTRWQRLPNPPAWPVQIVGGSLSTVFVETPDGQVYMCDVSEDQCWVAYAEPVEVAPRNEACESWPIHYAVSAPPGEVVDYFQAQWCHFEAGEESDYALLEDGSAWMWNHFDANLLNPTRVLTAMAGGCCAGLLGSIAVPAFVVLRRRARRAAQ